MNKISVKKINRQENSISVTFSVTEGLEKYFSGGIFSTEYFIAGQPIENFINVPDGVLVIPFVCNVLPIIWLTDSILVLEELDTQFFESINEFKKGYINMYPDCEFKGAIEVRNIIDCTKEREEKSIVFFSSGVDAYYTLLSHIHEKPYLMTIWGSDIPYKDYDGWNTLYSFINEEASKLGLPLLTVRSNFREFISESLLTEELHQNLHDEWWHGAQHGIGLIGHAAPVCCLYKIKTVYIAASYCKEARHTCASDPSIDNYVRYCGVSTVHDGFISRQKKIEMITKKAAAENIPVHLHVCWKTTTGRNCCVCEKCMRTIMGIFAEGMWPSDYGFPDDESVYKKSTNLCKYEIDYNEIVMPLWLQIQKRAVINRDKISEKQISKYISWIYEADFKTLNKSISRQVLELYRRVTRKVKHMISHITACYTHEQ